MTSPVLTTKKLDRHPGVQISTRHETWELLTVAPDQTIRGSLEMVGSDAALKTIRSSPPTTIPPQQAVIEVAESSQGHAAVTIKGTGSGLVALISSPDLFPVGGQIARITVGSHQQHLGKGGVDLLAAVSNGTDARKIVAIQQILHNRHDSILDQFTGTYGSKTTLSCGDVLQKVGTALFGKVTVDYNTYHRPIVRRPTKLGWGDVRYDETTMRNALSSIKATLGRGVPVRVGVAYDPNPGMLAPNGALQPTSSGGHFLLLVAYNDDRFLYLDPYPGGSKITYNGGLPFNQKRACGYMGTMKLVTDDRGPHLVSDMEFATKETLGPYEVIAGPTL